LRSRQAFRQQSFEGDAGGLFVPGDADVTLGDEVELEIHFLAEEVRFRIRAQVRWKRASGRRSAPPGLGLTFLATEEASRTQLLAFVDGDDVQHTERDTRRLPIHVEAKLELSGTTVVCQTDDISVGGCFVLLDAAELPPIGARLEVKLKGPATIFPWITLPAVVCWHRRDDRSGVGVRFVLTSESDRRRVERLVSLLKERVSREVRLSVPRPTSTPPTTTSSPPRLSQTPSMLPRK